MPFRRLSARRHGASRSLYSCSWSRSFLCKYVAAPCSHLNFITARLTTSRKLWLVQRAAVVKFESGEACIKSQLTKKNATEREAHKAGSPNSLHRLLGSYWRTASRRGAGKRTTMKSAVSNAITRIRYTRRCASSSSYSSSSIS